MKKMKRLLIILFVAFLFSGCKEDTTYVTFINSSPDKDLNYVVSHKGKVVFESQLPAGKNEVMEIPVGDIKVEVSGDGYNKTFEDTITKEEVDKKSVFGTFVTDLYDGNVIYVLNGTWFYEGHEDEDVYQDIIENPNSIFEIDADMIYYPYENLDLPDSIEQGTDIRILIPVPKDLVYSSADSVDKFIIDYVTYYSPEDVQ